MLRLLGCEEAAVDGLIARFILRGLGMALQKSLPVTAKVGREPSGWSSGAVGSVTVRAEAG